jgi:hypothetical protein
MSLKNWLISTVSIVCSSLDFFVDTLVFFFLYLLIFLFLYSYFLLPHFMTTIMKETKEKISS